MNAADSSSPRKGPLISRRRNAAILHWLAMIFSMAIVAAGASFKVYADQTVGCRFSPTQRLPPTCAIRDQLKFDCPGCGMTRSLIHFFRFQFAASWTANRCGWLLAMAFAAQLPYRIAALRRLKHSEEYWLEMFPYKLSSAWLVLVAISWFAKQFIGI
jgi:hypothetical protein